MAKRTKKIVVLFISFLFSYNSFSGNLGLYLENDSPHGSDEYYTHGTKLFYETENIPSYLKNLWKDKERVSGYIFGQNIYTPSNLKETEWIPDDRPYGGWLYLGQYLTARNETWMDLLELNIGVTGPPSLAEETQTLVHKWTKSQIPMGWKNQIKFEPGLNIGYQKKYRYRIENIFDVIPQAGGCIGNIFTYASIGTTARLGYNIPDDFGYLKVEPTTRVFKDENFLHSLFNGKFSIYTFIGGEGRWVGRNIFLDGNTFRKSHSIEKKEWVADYNGGIGIDILNFNIVFSKNYRTKEFKKQKKDATFSSFMISWRFAL